MTTGTRDKPGDTRPQLGRRLTIGLIADDIVRVGGQTALLGVADVARERDVNFLCFYQRLFQDKLNAMERGPAAWDTLAEVVDGVVLFQSWPSEEAFAGFRARFATLPMVNALRLYPGCPGLVADPYQGAKELVGHLIEEHGYRRIAFASGPEGNWSVMERYRGYVDTLAEHNLPLDPILVTPHFSWAGAWDALSSLLDDRGLKPGVDFEAVVASNDSMALGMIDWFHLRAVQVPDAVAVVGFDDDSGSACAAPPLTTMRAPTYEVGRQAAEMLLTWIAGEKPPDRTLVPAKMMVRRSCGCPFQAVAQAALAPRPAALSEPETVFRTQRAPVIAAMVRVVVDEGGVSEWVEQLWDGFAAEMAGAAPGRFLADLENILSRTMREENGAKVGPERRVVAWQGALSALRQGVVPWLGTAARARAEDLLQQGRVLLAVMVEQAWARQALRVRAQATALRELSRELSTTFAMERLMDVLAGGLPRLGIPGAYLCLYDGEEADGWSRLMLAYGKGGRVALDGEGLRFPSRQLAPEGLWPQERYNFVVKPLYSQDAQLGFILCEIGPLEGMVYETLGTQISSALYGVILVRAQKRAKADLDQAYAKLQEHSAELARQKYIMDTFMASVPDSIYFKDRDSRFTHVNQALLRRLGLGDMANLIGKSDFDFFPADQAQSKYDQEQAIARTGQAVFDLEEPDAGGRWALTTKMPLRDENGAIIGTFGVSRDITALKQAQLEVAAAYEEIKTLNVRLQEENLRMSAELDVSRRIQQMVLPTPAELVRIDGLHIAGYMRPAEEVGGDYYDVLEKNAVLHIGIGDVTGHGLESGVLMLMTQTAIRTLIEHGETDPRSFLTTLNRVILKNTQRMNVDKTLTFVLVKYQEGEIKIIGQHEELLVVRQGGHVERVDTFRLGLPLGLEENISAFLAEATVTLQDGDCLVLYTDGITEAENAHHQMYGLDRLCDVLSRQWDKPAEAIKQAVVEDVLQFIGSQTVYDDITLVVLKR